MTVIVHQMCAHTQCLCTIIIMSTWITCSDKVVDTFIIIRQSTIHHYYLNLSEYQVKHQALIHHCEGRPIDKSTCPSDAIIPHGHLLHGIILI